MRRASARKNTPLQNGIGPPPLAPTPARAARLCGPRVAGVLAGGRRRPIDPAGNRGPAVARQDPSVSGRAVRKMLKREFDLNEPVALPLCETERRDDEDLFSLDSTSSFFPLCSSRQSAISCCL
mmetsp:Transcript_13737/g.37006  ORF Transcript_13737/g.37006 Transcript_13737/m.37006 type:complete len:124 (+) Transcript_13737:315-686(+)